MSTKLANWALWWSLRKAITGSRPSGAISISSSSPAVSWTFWTNFGIHSATYLPKSVNVSRWTGSNLRMVAKKENVIIVILNQLCCCYCSKKRTYISVLMEIEKNTYVLSQGPMWCSLFGLQLLMELEKKSFLSKYWIKYIFSMKRNHSPIWLFMLFRPKRTDVWVASRLIIVLVAISLGPEIQGQL